MAKKVTKEATKEATKEVLDTGTYYRVPISSAKGKAMLAKVAELRNQIAALHEPFIRAGLELAGEKYLPADGCQFVAQVKWGSVQVTSLKPKAKGAAVTDGDSL